MERKGTVVAWYRAIISRRARCPKFVHEGRITAWVLAHVYDSMSMIGGDTNKPLCIVSLFQCLQGADGMRFIRLGAGEIGDCAVDIQYHMITDLMPFSFPQSARW